MAAGKKKPEEKDAGTTHPEYSLRDDAEKQLARSPVVSPDLAGQTPEKLIHELQVYQIELETQAEELRRARLAQDESRDKFLDLYDFAPIGYLTLTDKALIVEVNLTGATLLGVERSRLIRARFRKFIIPEDFVRWDRYFVNVLNRGEKQFCILTLKRDDNSVFPARLESIRITGSDGATTVRIAISDITDIWQIEALVVSEERYRRICEGLTDYLYTVRVQEGKAISTTHGAACFAVTGYTAEEFAADPYLWIRMVFDEDRNRVIRHVNTVLKGKPVHPVEHRIVRKDGQIRWVRDTPILHLDADGMLVLYDGVIKDITKHKVSEEIIKDAKEYAEKLIQTANAMIVGLDSHGRITTFNQSAEEITGYTAAELAGRNWFEVIVPKDRYPHVWEEFNRLLSGGLPKHFENPILTKSGEERYIVWKNSEIRDKGQIVGIIAFGIDITGRRKVEKALTENEARLRTTLEILPVGVFIFSRNGQILTANAMVNRIWGVTKGVVPHSSDMQEFVEYKGWWSDTGIALRPEDWAASRVLLGGEAAPVDIVNIRRFDGSNGTIIVSAVPFHDAGGDITGAVAVIQDITERKEAEEAQKARERSYRTLSENLPGIVFRLHTRENGRMQFFNNMLVTMTGYNEEELTEGEVCSIDSLIVAEDRDRIIAEVNAAIKDNRGFSVEYRIIHKDGTPRFFIERGRPIFDTDGLLCIDGIILDITDRKQEEKVLQHLTEFQDSIITNALVWLSVLDPAGKILVWNTAAAEISGYRSGEVLGKNEIWKLLYPKKEYRKQVTSTINRIIDEKKYLENFETVIRTREGNEKVISWNTKGIPDTTGKIADYIVIGMDVTDRHRAEEQLNKTVDELKRFNNLTVDRELRMIALKQEINALLKNAGEPEKYRIGT